MSEDPAAVLIEHAVMSLAALPPGSQHVWQHGLQRVLVCRRLDGRVSAMLDLCPHARQPLSGGSIDAVGITCPKHGARFDLESGVPLNAVCRRPLTMAQAIVRDDHIYLRLPVA